MKKYIKTLFGAVTIPMVFNACHNPDLLPAPEPEWAPVAVVKWTDEEKSFYNIDNIEAAEFEYQLEGEDFGYAQSEVVEIEVHLSMNGTGKKLFKTYTSFPVIVNVPAEEAAGEFGLTASELKVGDKFTFSYVVKSVDGRVFNLYGNNICNLIRVEGICSLDAFVLTPTVPLASVEAASNKFSVTDISGSGDDEYVFNLNKRDFVSTDLSAVNVEIAYTDSTGTSDFVMIDAVDPSSIPTLVSISASEVASLFGKTAAQLMPGDEFTVKFSFNTSSGSFSNFGSALCGVNFPNTIVHPFHNGITGSIPDLGFENPRGVATAPPATSTTGSCSLTIPITE